MLRPPAFPGVSIGVPGHTPTPAGPNLPALRLRLGRRRVAPGAALSFLIHATIIGLLVVRGRELLRRAPGDPGAAGGGGGATNFFTLPAAGPTAIDLPARPPVTPSELASLRQVKLEVPPIELTRETFTPALPPVAADPGTAGAGGQGAGGGRGPGTGTGAGATVGPGTGGEGGYIFVASPRTAILPPLAKVPGSVAGRTYRVRFWVAADGRVTRVEVDPPITDASYGREFQERMLAYRFYPARTRDGQYVASVVTVPLRIGN